MAFGQWCHEIQQANKDYDFGRINRDNYECRIVFAIYMAYMHDDEDYAKGVAKAHGYDIDEIIKEEGRLYPL